MSAVGTVTVLPTQPSPETAPDRAQYRTAKYRAEDLQPGDVTRNGFGKWARVTNVDADGLYVTVRFDGGGTSVQVRDVQLVDVQEVKPS